MTTAKITSKGQVTIPKDIRDRLGLRAGDRVDFAEEEGGGCRIKKLPQENPFDKWMGYLKHLAGRDVDEMMDEMRGQPR
jgi:AbrB family looped-hinge helix DNA binding protein